MMLFCGGSQIYQGFYSSISVVHEPSGLEPDSSRLVNNTKQHAHATDRTPLQVYKDPAYRISNVLLCPYQGVQIAEDQKQWNCTMSKLPIVAEWAFEEMVNMFGFLEYIKNEKHLLQPVGVQFRVVALLHNAHVCLHLPQITHVFDIWHEGNELEQGEIIEEELLQPPSLFLYFHN